MTSLSLHYNPAVLNHITPPEHPERPDRVRQTAALLEKSGLLGRLEILPVIPATQEQLERVHATAYIEHVAAVVASGGGYLDAGDTYASPGSWEAAVLAAGAAVGAVDAVMLGAVEASFALVRPPG